MSSVITGHSLEAPCEYLLFLADFLEGFGDILGEALQLEADIWQITFDSLMVLFRLVHVTSPLLSIVADLADSELVSHSFDL